MALVGIAVFKGNVGKPGISSAVQLLKSGIELAYPPEKIRRNAYRIFEQALECSLRNIQFSLNSSKGFPRSAGGNHICRVHDHIGGNPASGDQPQNIIVQQGQHDLRGTRVQ